MRQTFIRKTASPSDGDTRKTLHSSASPSGTGGSGGSLDNILDRALPRGKKEVALSAFSFLFSEIVQYSQSRVTQTNELEQKLMDLGYDMGQRFLDLSVFREKKQGRETKVEPMLHYINNIVWKNLFGKAPDSLQKSSQAANQYFIYEKEPLESRFISVPKNLGNLHVAYFTAGIIKGILVAAEFPCQVKVFYSENKEYTVFVIDFDANVSNR